MESPRDQLENDSKRQDFGAALLKGIGRAGSRKETVKDSSGESRQVRKDKDGNYYVIERKHIKLVISFHRGRSQ